MRRSRPSSTSLTETRPALPTGISRRTASPMARLSNSRTRSLRWEDMGVEPLERSQFGGDFLGGVRLDHVADLKLVKAIDANAAIHAGPDFVDFVLEPAEGKDVSFVEQALAAHDPDLALDQAPVPDDAAGDVAALGQFENLFHV